MNRKEKPKKKTISAIVVVYPEGICGFNNFLIMVINPKRKPNAAKIIPLIVAILRGLTEKLVNPFAHRAIIFFKE